MAGKILEAPKIIEKGTQQFSTETPLSPMSTADGGIPKSSGPTDEQIKASGWFAGSETSEGDKKTEDTKSTKDKKITGTKEDIEQSLESSEEKATEGGLTEDKTEDKADERKEESDLPDFLKLPEEKTASDKEREQTNKSIEGKLAKGKVFDYTGFSADEQKHLKNMDKAAREYTAGLIRKSKEIVTQETSYLQHPNGYLLAPEYQTAQANLSSMTQQYNHWKQQLLNTRDGKNVQDIAIDEKTGKIIVTGEFKPNDQIEELCRENMILIQQKAEIERSMVASFPQRFKQTLARDTMEISKTLESVCPWLTKLELLNYRMDVKFADGVTRNASLGELKQSFLNKFPPYMRSGNIGIEVAANLWLGMLIHQKSAETASLGKKAAEIKTAEGRRAEPSTSGKKQEVKKTGGVSEFSTANAGIEFGI